MRQPATIIVPPSQTWVENGLSHSNNPRTFDKVDRFAAQLAEAAGFEVPIIEGSLADAPKDGFLFVYEQDYPFDEARHAAFTKLGPRIICLLAERGDLMGGSLMDDYELAAAVESQDYFRWKMGPGGGRINGLVSVGEKAGLSLGFHLPRSAYGFLMIPAPGGPTIGELFVRYLTVYEEMGLHLRPPKTA